MRYLFLLPLALILITSCSKSDREAVNGSWSFVEVRDGQKLLYSTDKAQIDKIIDERIKEEGAMYAQMGMDENMMRQQLEQSFKDQAKFTWDFNEKDTMTINSNSGKTAEDMKVKFSIDPEKKKLTLKGKEKGDNTEFTYTLEDDKLVLKKDKSEIHMVRKGE